MLGLVTIMDYSNTSVLHYLAYSGNYEAIQQALNDKIFDQNMTDNKCHTVWHYLAGSGNYEALQHAINKGLCDSVTAAKDDLWGFLLKCDNRAAIRKAIDDGIKIKDGPTVRLIPKVDVGCRSSMVFQKGN